MNMMRKTINKSLPYIVGIIIGIVSFLPFTRPTSTAAFLTGFGKDAINQWNYYLDYGLESQNIWQRAYVSLLGLLPSASPEVIYLQTSFDDRGESLSGNCSYTLSGEVPDARYWSYAIYGNDNYYLQDPNSLFDEPTFDDLFAQVTNGSELTSIIGENYIIKIDNNQINQNGTLSHFGNDFTLIYRIYGPNLNYYENPTSIPVASIINEGCK